MMKLFPSIKITRDHLILALISLGLLLILYLPFIIYNPLQQKDLPGHYFLAWYIKNFTWPDPNGWNPYFFAGYPQGTFYPQLFHWITATLGFVIPLETAFKLVIGLAGISLPFAVYSLATKVVNKENNIKGISLPLVTTIITLIFLLFIPGYVGSSFKSVFALGLVPNFVSLPIFFWYLSRLFDKRKGHLGNALVLTILFHTHLVSTLVAAFISIFIFLQDIITQLTQARRRRLAYKGREFLSNETKRLLKTGLLAALLSAWWWLPYLAFRQYTSFVKPARSLFLPNVAVLVFFFLTLTLFLFKLLKPKLPTLSPKALAKTDTNYSLQTTHYKLLTTKSLPLLITGILLITIALADCVLTRGNFHFHLPPLHPYRLQAYTYLLIPFLIPDLLRALGTKEFLESFPKKISIKLGSIFSFTKQSFYYFTTLFFLAIFLLGLTIRDTEAIGLSRMDFDTPEYEGRLIRGYRIADMVDRTRVPVHEVVFDNEKNISISGLLEESSYIGPYLVSLIKSLNPDEYHREYDIFDDFYIEDRIVPYSNAEDLMQYLQINYVITDDEDFPKCSDFERLTDYKTCWQGDETVRDLFLCKYKKGNFKLAEALNYSPEAVSGNDFDKKVEGWWRTQGATKKIFIESEQEVEFKPADAQTKVEVLEKSKRGDEIKIKIDAKEDVPVLVKVSYFPKWKAYEKYGGELRLYRASPNLILLNGRGEITLKYEPSTWETVGLLTTISGLLVFATALMLPRFPVLRRWLNKVISFPKSQSRQTKPSKERHPQLVEILVKGKIVLIYLLLTLTPLLYFPIFTSPYRFPKTTFFFALSVLLLTFTLLQLVWTRPKQIKITTLDLPLLLFFLINCITAYFSVYPRESILGHYGYWATSLITTSLLVILARSVAVSIKSAETQTYAILAIISGATITSFYAIAQYIFNFNLMPGAETGRTPSTLGQPVVFGFYLALCFPFAIAALARARKLYRYLSLIPLFSIFSAIILTFSRSAWLSIIIGFTVSASIFLALGYQKQNKNIILFAFGKLKTIKHQILRNKLLTALLTGGLVAILSVTAIHTVSRVKQTWETSSSEDTLRIRLVQWKDGLKIWRDNKLTGIGQENIFHIYPQYRDIVMNEFPSEITLTPVYIQNVYINYLGTQGIVGLISFLILLFIAFRSFINKILSLLQKKNSQGELAFVFAAFASLMVYTIHAFAYRPTFTSSIMLFCLLGLSAQKRIATFNKLQFAKLYKLHFLRLFTTGIIVMFMVGTIYILVRMTLADYYINRAHTVLVQNHEDGEPVEITQKAIDLFPFYQDIQLYHVRIAVDEVSRMNGEFGEFSPALSESQQEINNYLVEEIQKRLDRLLNKYPDDLKVLYTARHAYLQLARAKQIDPYLATGIADRTLEKSPGHPLVTDTAGLTYLEAKDFEKAEELFWAALAQKPDQWRSYLHLGEVLRQAGKHQEAITYYQKVVKEHPEYAGFALGEIDETMEEIAKKNSEEQPK